MRDNVVFMGIGIMKKKMERITVYVPQELKEKLKQKGIPMSQCIRWAIEVFLTRRTKINTNEFQRIISSMSNSEKKEIGYKLSEITGMSYRTLMRYLPDQLKDQAHMRSAKHKRKRCQRTAEDKSKAL